MVSEGWKWQILGEVAELQRGFDLPKAARTKGSVPIISSSGTSGYHNEHKAEAPGVVTGRYGSIGEVFFIEENFWPLNTSLWVKNFHGNHAKFIYYLLSKFDFAKFSDKTGVPGVNRNDLHAVKVGVPPVLEQKKIALILTTWDQAISATERLLENSQQRKKVLMQQLLTGKKRLPGFEGEWEEFYISELEGKGWLKLGRGKVISKTDINNTPGQYPIYSSSVKNDGLMGGYGKFMFDEELISWSVDGGGNFFYRPKHKFSVTNVSGYMRLDTDHLSYKFLAEQLVLLHERYAFDYQIKAHPSVIRKLYQVKVPKLVEQKEIAEILTVADAEIANHKVRVEYLKEEKKALMQQLLTGKRRVQVEMEAA